MLVGYVDDVTMANSVRSRLPILQTEKRYTTNAHVRGICNVEGSERFVFNHNYGDSPPLALPLATLSRSKNSACSTRLLSKSTIKYNQTALSKLNPNKK